MINLWMILINSIIQHIKCVHQKEEYFIFFLIHYRKNILLIKIHLICNLHQMILYYKVKVINFNIIYLQMVLN